MGLQARHLPFWGEMLSGQVDTNKQKPEMGWIKSGFLGPHGRKEGFNGWWLGAERMKEPLGFGAIPKSMRRGGGPKSQCGDWHYQVCGWRS